MEDIVINKELKKNREEIKRINIRAFSNLNRDGLAYGVKERRLLLKEFDTGERLYIQYPGKESDANKENPKEWDFRPKLWHPERKWMGDLEFKEIIDDIYGLGKEKIDISNLATVFLRMAYGLDLKKVTRNLDYEDINPKTENDNDPQFPSEDRRIEFTWYEYNPDSEILKDLDITPRKEWPCSLLPYLAYIDCIAQNEDCKYFYLTEWKSETEGNGVKNWDSNKGRRNTCLSFVSIMAFIEGRISFGTLLGKFISSRVALLPEKEWGNVTGGRIRNK